jgi:fibronectin-binding autotransporter adhesin
MAILGLAAVSASAAIVFYEDFESPVVNGYAEGTSPVNWVRAASGFGSGSHGLDNKNGDDFAAPFGNDQAYAFRYTNSGLTTAEGFIGQLTGNVTYTISFDVVRDGGGGNGTPYNVQLIAFAAGADRSNCQSIPANSALLTNKSGNATSDGAWTTVNFSYRTDNGNPYLFKDLGIRLIGGSITATIDNVQVADRVMHWDTNGSTAGAGGATPSGTWDAATTNWSTDSAGSVATEAWPTGGFTPFFGAGGDATGAYSVTVAGTQDIDGMAFEEGTVTLSSGTSAALRLRKDTTIAVASGSTATVEPALTKYSLVAQKLTKVGFGTLVLAGNNTYTGATTVVAGKLILSGSNASATGVTTVNGGVIQYESPASINGTGRKVTVNARGAVVFGPSFGAGNIPTALLGRIVAASAGTIAADNYAGTNFDFNTPGLTAAYLGAVGDVTYTGTLTPNGTAYRLGGGGGTLTYTQVLTGSGYSLVVGGDVVLSAANDYTGVTTVSRNGTLSVSSLANAGQSSNLGAYGAAGAAGVVLTGGSTLRYTGGSTSIDRGFTLSGINCTVDVSSGGTALTFGNCSLGAYTLIVTGGAGSSLSIGSAALTGATTLYPTTANLAVASVSGGYNLTLSGTAGASAINGEIGIGSRELTKSGSSTWALSGSNNYTGVTIVTGGVLRLDSAGALPGGIGTTGGTSGLTFNGGVIGLGAGDFTRALASAGIVTGVNFAGAGGWAAYGADRLVNLGGASDTIDWGTGNTGFFGYTVILGASTATHTVTLQNPLNLGTAARTVQADDGAAEIDGALSGLLSSTSTGGGLVKSGAGTLALTNAANTYAGATNISAGVLSVGKLADGGQASSIGQSTNADTNLLLGNGATLKYVGAGDSTDRRFRFNGSLAGLSVSLDASGAGPINFTSTTGPSHSNANQTRTLKLIGNNTGENTLAANIGNNGTGVLSVIKDGPGTWVLSGVNTYTGATTINKGTLLLNANQSLATGAVTVQSDATLGGNGTIGGPVTVNTGGRLLVSPGGMGMSGNLFMSDEAEATFVFTNPLVKDSKVTGDGALTLAGTLNVDFSGGTYGDGWSAVLFDGIYGTFYSGDFAEVTATGLASGMLATFDVSTMTLTLTLNVVPGDTNDDKVVDAADFINLKKNFNKFTSGATKAEGDFNSSGTVNWADLGILMNNMGTGGGAPATAPEPCSAMLLMFGAAALLRRRRKA